MFLVTGYKSRIELFLVVCRPFFVSDIAPGERFSSINIVVKNGPLSLKIITPKIIIITMIILTLFQLFY
jgi:hypothetical protein